MEMQSSGSKFHSSLDGKPEAAASVSKHCWCHCCLQRVDGEGGVLLGEAAGRKCSVSSDCWGLVPRLWLWAEHTCGVCLWALLC